MLDRAACGRLKLRLRASYHGLFLRVADFTNLSDNLKEFSNHVQPQFTPPTDVSDFLFRYMNTCKIRFDQRDCLGINPHGH